MCSRRPTCSRGGATPRMTPSRTQGSSACTRVCSMASAWRRCTRRPSRAGQRHTFDTRGQCAAKLVPQSRLRPITEIGAAVAGTGFIGVVHVEALRRLGVQVRGVVGSSAERAAERARDLGLSAYESFEAMLADPRVEVVHIATPNHLHHEQAKAALAAGKHVVCEKPLAISSTQSADLLRLAGLSGLVHAVTYNLRSYPVLQPLHGLVGDGGLGEVRLVSGHYLQDWMLHEDDWSWRLDPRLGGGLRAAADIGSHWMDMSSFLTGRRIEAVMADLATFIKSRRGHEMTTEDAATILLRYEGGVRGAMATSQVSPGRKNSLEFEIDRADSAASGNSERPDEP